MPYKELAKKRESARDSYYANREQVLKRKRIYYVENFDRIKAYRDANREKCRERDRERYYANHDKQLKRHSRYRTQNLEKCRERMRKWRHLNPGYTTKYYAKNPGKCLAHYAKRRALKRSATIGDLTAISKVYGRAKELRKWFDVVVDHKIPLAKGGIHAPDNLQIIYRKDNLIKFCRLDFKPAVIFL